MRFYVRFRGPGRNICTWGYPCDDYTPEECDAEVEFWRGQGFEILSTWTEFE